MNLSSEITDPSAVGESARGAPPHADRASRAEDLFAAPTRQRGLLIVLLIVGAALYLGWQSRSEQHLTAESGLGYLLGIVGGVLMLLLLLYPLRKRVRFMRRLGATKHWFRAHMLLGIIGPAIILFHANFNLGSLNSRIALASMLLVAASGLIGRYIYSKIHYGLYGRRMNLVDLRQTAEDSGSQLGAILSFDPGVQRRLRKYEAAVLLPPRTVLHSAARILYMAVRTRLPHLAIRWKLYRAIRAQAKREGWSARERRRHARNARRYLSVYLATVRRVTGYTFFERMFALWHVLHLPLFLILVVTGAVHVVAVHMY